MCSSKVRLPQSRTPLTHPGQFPLPVACVFSALQHAHNSPAAVGAPVPLRKQRLLQWLSWRARRLDMFPQVRPAAAIACQPRTAICWCRWSRASHSSGRARPRCWCASRRRRAANSDQALWQELNRHMQSIQSELAVPTVKSVIGAMVCGRCMCCRIGPGTSSTCDCCATCVIGS